MDDPDLLAPDLAADLRADALILKRGEFLSALPWLAAAIFVLAFAFAEPRLWLGVGPACFIVVVWVGRIGLEWRRLNRSNYAELHREQRQDDRAKAARAREHEKRWLSATRVMTPALAIVIGIVTAVQLVVVGVEKSVPLAALVKPDARAGEWWRLLTASYLHGSLGHLAGNLSALLLFGGLIETYDRRWRVPLAYLAGVLGGSVASLALTPASSLGASAGVLGLLGYLLVAAGRESSGVPKWFRRPLLWRLGLIAVTGGIAFLLVDNAGHAGGVAGGILVGFITAPSKGTSGGSSARAWDAAGWAAAVFLLVGAVFTITKLLRLA